MWAGSGKKYKIVDASQTRIYKILRWAVLTRQEYREMGDNQRLTEWMGGWMDGWIKIKL